MSDILGARNVGLWPSLLTDRPIERTSSVDGERKVKTIFVTRAWNRLLVIANCGRQNFPMVS